MNDNINMDSYPYCNEWNFYLSNSSYFWMEVGLTDTSGMFLLHYFLWTEYVSLLKPEICTVYVFDKIIMLSHAFSLWQTKDLNSRTIQILGQTKDLNSRTIQIPGQTKDLNSRTIQILGQTKLTHHLHIFDQSMNTIEGSDQGWIQDFKLGGRT